ncbi:hypothetical protein D9M70_368200 [compost metagenome]
MPPRSKVSTLPPEVKTWLDQALVESNFSGYELLSAELAERGYDIKKSALGEYGKDFKDRLAALAMASEQAKAVVAAAPDDEGAVNEALMRLTQEKLFQLLLASEGKLDISKVGKTVAELVKASVVQKKWSAEVRAKAEAAAASVEKIARKGGLNAETVAEIRREILGVAA